MAKSKISEVDLKDPDFFEDVLMKYLFTDSEIRDKVVPFLSESKVFHKKVNSLVMDSVFALIEQYEEFPSAKEVFAHMDDEDAFDHLDEVLNMELGDFKKTFLMDQIETFFRKKLIENITSEVSDSLNDEDWYNPDAVDKLREAYAFSFNCDIGMDIFSSAERMYEFFHDEKIFTPTDIRNFDVLIQGGFHNKTLSLFMAGTNVGKSLIMASLAVNNMYRNKKVLYISCEMSEEKITERVLSNTFDVPIADLPRMSKENFVKRFESFSQYKQQFMLKEYPPRKLNANKIRNLLKELKLKKNFIPEIIYVDYLALMMPNINTKGQATHESLTIITEELRAVAVEFDVPIVSAVQVGRDGLSSTDIDLDDISGSIGITFTADVIIAVTQSDELLKDGKYCWTIIKNRYGQKKCWLTVNVDFERMRITYDKDNDTLEYATRDGSNPNQPSRAEKKEKEEEVDEYISLVKKKNATDVKQKLFDFE
jgi:hypothetical protein